MSARKGRSALARAAWAAGMLVGGCATVIGADDYQVGVKPPVDGGDPASVDGGTSNGKPAGSGESLCTSTCAAGLTCTGSSFGTLKVCASSCHDDTDCAAGHSCIGAETALANSCLKRCPDESCPAGLACVHLASSGLAICFPHDWSLGVGDPCKLNSQCPSGTCQGAPNGFCTRTCTPGDACAGDHADLNATGDKNSCTQVKGNFICVPGCNVDTTCSAYPDTSCKQLLSGASVCVP